MGKQEEVSLLLRLKDGVTKAFGEITGSFNKNISALKESSLIFAGAFAGVVAGIIGSVKAFSDSQAVAAQTEKVLMSTGFAAGMTAVEINKLAVALQNKTGIDDDVIQSGQNMLLTFTNVGKDAFPLATKAALDMTAAFNQGNVTNESLKGTMIQLGKALNDPAQGMSALRRVGVAFTESQQSQIKALQASGDLYGAQTLILKELEKEFGGSSEKLGTLQGAFLMAKTQAGNFMELVGEQIAPAMQKLAEFISTTVVKLGDFVRAHKELIVPVGAAITIFTGLMAALAGIVTIAPTVAAAWLVISGPIGITVAAIAGLTAATVYFYTSQTKLAENVRAVWGGLQGFFTGNIDKMKAAYKDLSESKAVHDEKMTADTKKRAEAEAAALQKDADAARAAAEQKAKADIAFADAEVERKTAEAQVKAGLKAAELEADLEYSNEILAADEEFMAAKADLEQINEDARIIFETQKKQFDTMNASDRVKLIADTLGKERVLRAIANIDELVAKGKHEEAKKAMNQLYTDAFVELNKKKIEDIDSRWKKHWTGQVAMAIMGKNMTAEQYEAMGSFYSSVLTIMGKESVAAFRTMQAVAIVTGLVQTYQSAIAAFNSLAAIPIVGSVLGAVAAAAAIASGLMNVENIRRQQPPQAETGAYVKQGGMVEVHDAELILNKQQTAEYQGGGSREIYLQIDGETLQKWVLAADSEGQRMDRMGVR